jgi:hypothetical protein
MIYSRKSQLNLKAQGRFLVVEHIKKTGGKSTLISQEGT